MKLKQLKKMIDAAIEKIGEDTTVNAYGGSSTDWFDIKGLFYDFYNQELLLEIED